MFKKAQQNILTYFKTFSEIEKRRLDKSLIFFVALSAAICMESYKLGLGSFSTPDAGLFPFLLGSLIGVLAIIIQFTKILSKEETDVKISIRYKRMIPLAAGLFAYVLLLGLLGTVIATFLLIVFFLKVMESLSWKITILVAIGMPLLIHLLFRVFFRIQLPRGFLGF